MYSYVKLPEGIHYGYTIGFRSNIANCKCDIYKFDCNWDMLAIRLHYVSISQSCNYLLTGLWVINVTGLYNMYVIVSQLSFIFKIHL